jgi:small subunit ribosomal protein S16
MLAIRMQRQGRKGHPTYRVVVQDVRQTPTSGKTVAMLGSYDPHTKTHTLVKDKAEFYLNNGAQPSERVVRLFASEGIVLPAWVKLPAELKRSIRNPDKLRRNQPKEDTSAEEPAAAEEATAASDEAAIAPETDETPETAAADTDSTSDEK